MHKMKIRVYPVSVRCMNWLECVRQEYKMHACLPHADGRGDGVADGHANQVDVLGQRAEPVLANPCNFFINFQLIIVNQMIEIIE